VLALGDEVVGQIEEPAGIRLDVPRLSPLCPGRSASGHVEAMAHYAGQSVDHVLGQMPAKEIVAELLSTL
jgi:hypothetical protein